MTIGKRKFLKEFVKFLELTVGLKGTLSGEHGIGLVQKNYMDIGVFKSTFELMERIKAILTQIMY